MMWLGGMQLLREYSSRLFLRQMVAPWSYSGHLLPIFLHLELGACVVLARKVWLKMFFCRLVMRQLEMADISMKHK